VKASALIALAIGSAAALWSCRIDRPSESLVCYGHADCETGRICEGGYCIVGVLPADARDLDAAVCPSVCNGSCNFSTSTCMIIGTGSNVTCPTGWNCHIECPTANACGAVNCGSAASCDIECTAGNACASISCMTKNCDVTCTGANACGNISCTSGNCTAACSGGNNLAVCGSLTCGAGNCTRTCTGTNACGTMNCAGGACTEVCGGGADACGAVACGSGKCTATCQGMDGACNDVVCDNSCQCDINCDVATNICPNMTCPDPNGGVVDECEDTAGRCDSSETPNRCRKCL
jgi:hypothetical protein